MMISIYLMFSNVRFILGLGIAGPELFGLFGWRVLMWERRSMG